MFRFILIFRFTGVYDTINGGYMEDASLCLSGGTYDIYHTEVVLYVTNNTPVRGQYALQYLRALQYQYSNNIKQVVPDTNELYEILRYAIKCKNIVGVHALDV
jgi:hypothetical protein